MERPWYPGSTNKFNVLMSINILHMQWKKTLVDDIYRRDTGALSPHVLKWEFDYKYELTHKQSTNVIIV